jgi:hypothetical protein
MNAAGWQEDSAIVLRRGKQREEPRDKDGDVRRRLD